MYDPDVIGPVVTGFAFFLGGRLDKFRRLAGDDGAAPEGEGSRNVRMVTAIRRLGVERDFRRSYDEADRWNWRASGARLPVRLARQTELEARLDAIGELEAMSRLGADNLVPVMEALCIFVRQNAEIEDEAEVQEPREDLQAALAAIGRLETRHAMRDRAGLEICRANLMLTMLTLVRLPKAWLAGADLTGSRLDYAVLSEAVLTGASLIATRLKGADLSGAELSSAEFLGANLESANLNGARLRHANLSHTSFSRARLDGASLERANLADWTCDRASLRGTSLEGAHNLDPATLATCFGVKSGLGRTLLPEGVAPPQHWHAGPEAGEDSDAALKAYDARYRAWLTVYPDRV